MLADRYDRAMAQNWGPGDRFKSFYGDGWYTGTVKSHHVFYSRIPDSPWNSLLVKWDDPSEEDPAEEALSPWDLDVLTEADRRAASLPASQDNASGKPAQGRSRSASPESGRVSAPGTGPLSCPPSGSDAGAATAATPETTAATAATADAAAAPGDAAAGVANAAATTVADAAGTATTAGSQPGAAPAAAAAATVAASVAPGTVSAGHAGAPGVSQERETPPTAAGAEGSGVPSDTAGAKRPEAQ